MAHLVGPGVWLRNIPAAPTPPLEAQAYRPQAV